MKMLFMVLFPVMVSSLAQAGEGADIYQAAETLSRYVQQKDEQMNASQIYRRILDNMDQRGVELALLRPLQLFHAMERDSDQKNQLMETLLSLGEEPKPKVGPKDISIVASASDACVRKCIDEVLDGARDGVAIGGAIGVGGGPAVAGASAAGGAVIGAGLGGVKCSLSFECKDESQGSSSSKFGWPPGSDLDRVKTANIAQDLKKKREVVVNNGPRVVKRF